MIPTQADVETLVPDELIRPERYGMEDRDAELISVIENREYYYGGDV